jgi:hypothetical protein
MPPNAVSQSRSVRKLYCTAKEIGLTDDERMDLATLVLRRDVTSWKQLDEAQVLRMLDAIEGYSLISELMRQRT